MKISGIYCVLLIASVLITNSIQTRIPRCFRNIIDDILSELVWNPPATITKYLYGGQTTYLLSSDCCDQFNNLYDASCNRICAPSGGFTGRGDGRCSDFQQNARFRGRVWTDPRLDEK